MVQVVADKGIIPVSEDIMFSSMLFLKQAQKTMLALLLAELRLEYNGKSMFGKEETVCFLREFLQNILGEQGKNLGVVSIENPNIIPNNPALKYAIVDVLVKLESGEIVQVEMQNKIHKAFDKRMLYYHSGLFSNQQVKGDDYPTIKRTISICMQYVVAVLKHRQQCCPFC